MGEIADALRRARERRRGREGAEESGQEAPEPSRYREPEREPAAELGALEEPELPADVGEIELSAERVGEWRPRALAVDDRGPVAESFRHLALKVRSALERRNLRSVVVTGPLEQEGKTTVACNLALAFGSVLPERSVALVDLDLRLASIADDLGLSVRAGFEEVLRGEKRLGDACVYIDRPAIDVYPCAGRIDAPHELLGRREVGRIVRELERRYAVVVYDSPPALLVSDTRLFLEHGPAWVAVGRSGSTRTRALERMMELLPRERFLGAVLNEGALAHRPYTYDSYYYGDSHARRREEAS